MTKSMVLLLASEFVVLVMLLTVALDVHLHRKFEGVGAVNIWGYRGKVMPPKRRDELRIAVVGGTLAFGWGVDAGHTLSGYLPHFVSVDLDKASTWPAFVTSVNVAGIDASPSDYAARLRRYAYLAPDVVCIEPDPPGGPEAPPRHGSPERSGVFAMTGYVPVLPLVLEEKGRVLGSAAAAPALSAAGRILDRIDVSLKRVSGERSVPRPTGAAAAAAVAVAVDTALQLGSSVVVVLPPRQSVSSKGLSSKGLAAAEGLVADGGDEGPAALVLPGRLVNDPRVRVVDLGMEPTLEDDALWIGRNVLGAAGNSATASLVTPAILELIRR